MAISKQHPEEFRAIMSEDYEYEFKDDVEALGAANNLLGFMEVLLKTDRQIKNSQLEPKQVEP